VVSTSKFRRRAPELTADPKITVLLDNYNYARFLGTAIESVLSQTYENFELIIVDDGSTDSSRQVISSYKDSRIVPVLQENGGQGAAFKAGISRASGEYIAFLDSDDAWDQDKLEACVAVLKSDSDIVLLNHGFRYVDAEGTYLKDCDPFRTTGVYSLLEDARKRRAEFSLVPTSFIIGRTKECQTLQFDEREWRVGGDTPVILGLALKGKAFNLDRQLGVYRVHGENLWHGHYDLATLHKHHQRMYDLINQELLRQDSKQSFDYQDTDFAIDYAIIHKTRWSFSGLRPRIKKALRKATGSWNAQ
jgi:glycosyltransferase involved in cell wall biosynthesis